MTIEQDVLKPELPARIELFDFDLTMIPGLPTTYYHLTPMTDASGTAAVMFGNTQYTPFPIKLSGIEHVSEGAPPRPKLELSNISKLFGALVFQYNDIVGAKVTYTETFATYLNTAQRISAPPLTFYVSKKLNHNSKLIVFELRNPLDKERAVLPKRQMLKRDFPGLGVNKQSY